MGLKHLLVGASSLVLLTAAQEAAYAQCASKPEAFQSVANNKQVAVPTGQHQKQPACLDMSAVTETHSILSVSLVPLLPPARK
jgi:hypothetical protein